MNYKLLVNNIFSFYKNNFNDYIESVNDKVELVNNFTEGDVNVLDNNQINFYCFFDTLNFSDLENNSQILELNSQIVLLFKIKKKNEDVNNIVKEYVSFLYNFIKKYNTFDNNVDYTRVENIELYEVDEQNQFNLKVIVAKVNYYTEIN